MTTVPEPRRLLRLTGRSRGKGKVGVGLTRQETLILVVPAMLPILSG